MQCKICGGEVNLAVGRCVRCGRPIDSAGGSKIFSDIDELVENYGIEIEDSNAGKKEEFVPMLFSTDAVSAVVSAEKLTKEVPEEEPEHTPEANINLETYLSRLEVTARNIPKYMPPAPQIAEDKPPAQPEQPIEAEAEPAADNETPAAQDDADAEQEEESIWKRGFMWVDKRIAPATDKVMSVYRAKFPTYNRVAHSPIKERVAVVGVFLACVAVLVIAVSLILSSIAASVTGEWTVADELTVEFTSGGKVISRVWSDGQPHVEREGTYTTRRSNGRNLLTITYEDGTVRNLYYTVDGDTGTFTNVDTNLEDIYIRK